MIKQIFIVFAIVIINCEMKVVAQSKSNPLPFTKWKLISFTSGESLSNLKKDITLKFDSVRVSGSAGCNDLFGSYTISGNSILFEKMFLTKVLCYETIDLERIYLKILHEANSYKIERNQLRLYKDKEELAVLVQIPYQSLDSSDD